MTPDVLTMRQVAHALGYSYDRFRKVWPLWVRDLAFPRPFTGAGLRRTLIKWDAADVLAWKAARKAALGPRDALPPPDPLPPFGGPAATLDAPPDAHLLRRAGRDRATLRSLMTQGA